MSDWHWYARFWCHVKLFRLIPIITRIWETSPLQQKTPSSMVIMRTSIAFGACGRLYTQRILTRVAMIENTALSSSTTRTKGSRTREDRRLRAGHLQVRVQILTSWWWGHGWALSWSRKCIIPRWWLSRLQFCSRRCLLGNP